MTNIGVANLWWDKHFANWIFMPWGILQYAAACRSCAKAVPHWHLHYFQHLPCGKAVLGCILLCGIVWTHLYGAFNTLNRFTSKRKQNANAACENEANIWWWHVTKARQTALICKTDVQRTVEWYASTVGTSKRICIQYIYIGFIRCLCVCRTVVHMYHTFCLVSLPHASFAFVFDCWYFKKNLYSIRLCRIYSLPRCMPNSVQMYHMFCLLSLPHASFAFVFRCKPGFSHSLEFSNKTTAANHPLRVEICELRTN